MFDTLRLFTYNLGLDLGPVPDWALALFIILVVLLSLRVLNAVADRLLRLGCFVVALGAIVIVLLELFR